MFISTSALPHTYIINRRYHVMYADTAEEDVAGKRGVPEKGDSDSASDFEVRDSAGNSKL